jgi:hypothetical protein
MILLKASAWLNEEDATPFPWQYPATCTESLRYKTFKDLWKKGHYLTGGQKFGADFLVYTGMHHSTFFLCRLSCALWYYHVESFIPVLHTKVDTCMTVTFLLP